MDLWTLIESMLNEKGRRPRIFRQNCRELKNACTTPAAAGNDVMDACARLVQWLTHARDMESPDMQQVRIAADIACLILTSMTDPALLKEALSGFLAILPSDGASDTVSAVLAYNLVFLEPSLPEDLRPLIVSRISTNESLCRISAVVDTFAGYAEREAFHRIRINPKCVELLQKTLDKLKVISVHSLKGGVGKSILCHALARQMATEGGRPCVIDLDFFGPCAQFVSHLPRLHETLLSVSANNSIDLPKYAELSLWLDDTLEGARFKPEHLIYDTTWGGAVVPLTHSSTKLPRIAWQSRTEADFKNYLERIANLLGVVADHGCTHAILDTHPGLYCHQGQLIEFLTTHARSSLCIVSNPNPYDLLSTAYEMVWIATRLQAARARTVWVGNKWQRGNSTPMDLLYDYLDSAITSRSSIAHVVFRDSLTIGRFMLPDTDKDCPPGVCSYANRLFYACSLPHDSVLTRATTMSKRSITNTDVLEAVATKTKTQSSGVWYQAIGSRLLPLLK